ncbi:helix-turn-helix domain-containing protein, partial [[Clostridium] clostridioforme]|nr:helix-turn-helix domain-containing protein [Enterocloster clostridioformis]
VSQWSLPLLVAEIKKQGIAEQISEKSVSRFLKMR